MFSRHRQSGDVHGDTAIHVESTNQEETTTTHYSSADRETEKQVSLPCLCCSTGQYYFTVQDQVASAFVNQSISFSYMLN